MFLMCFLCLGSSSPGNSSEMGICLCAGGLPQVLTFKGVQEKGVGREKLNSDGNTAMAWVMPGASPWGGVK